MTNETADPIALVRAKLADGRTISTPDVLGLLRMCDHFQQLASDNHDMQQAEIERLRAEVKRLEEDVQFSRRR